MISMNYGCPTASAGAVGTPKRVKAEPKALIPITHTTRSRIDEDSDYEYTESPGKQKNKRVGTAMVEGEMLYKSGTILQRCRVLALLPVHPSLAKMIVLGIVFHCLDSCRRQQHEGNDSSASREMTKTQSDAKHSANPTATILP